MSIERFPRPHLDRVEVDRSAAPPWIFVRIRGGERREIARAATESEVARISGELLGSGHNVVWADA